MESEVLQDAGGEGEDGREVVMAKFWEYEED